MNIQRVTDIQYFFLSVLAERYIISDYFPDLTAGEMRDDFFFLEIPDSFTCMCSIIRLNLVENLFHKP